MQLTPIPYSFVRQHLDLSWDDLLWGYEHGLIGWSGIVDHAMGRVASGTTDPKEIELASLTKTDAWRVGELLRQIVFAPVDEQKRLAQRKWLYLILAWLFENRSAFSDPLGQVEVIYADFDYPHEMESFVRYMPPIDEYDPAIHSQAENEKRLFENWQRYLNVAAAQFKS